MMNKIFKFHYHSTFHNEFNGFLARKCHTVRLINLQLQINYSRNRN